MSPTDEQAQQLNSGAVYRPADYGALRVSVHLDCLAEQGTALWGTAPVPLRVVVGDSVLYDSRVHEEREHVLRRMRALARDWRAATPGHSSRNRQPSPVEIAVQEQFRRKGWELIQALAAAQA